MSPKKEQPVATARPARRYEFGGPLGAAGVSFGLPILLYLFALACNDISGCPAPSLLSPSTLSLEILKDEAGWPADGIYGLVSWKVTGWTLAYYLLSMVLFASLPGTEVQGTQLANGGRLKYKFNGFSSSLFILAICLAGTVRDGANFVVWTFMTDNYLQLLTTNVLISYALATYCYFRSFGVNPGNPELRELAAGGLTGNAIYDWFIGRELNPRVTIPLVGELDIKTFMEERPGLLGWMLFNLAFCAKQYRNYGFVTDSIVFVTAVQALYVMDSLYLEPAILTMIDITTDGFGCMLAFGDLVWVPFLYSTQTRYLATYPHSLGPVGLAAVAAVLATGYLIFRLANLQKDAFRRNPDDSSVTHLEFIETKAGTRLLVSGWWGLARHVNYLGDWLQAWPYSLPTGVAGYVINRAGTSSPEGALRMLDGRRVVQASARGWGMLFTYFYVVYFAILLVHRERRDDEKCAKKYGDDWKKYKKIVRWKILPGVY